MLRFLVSRQVALLVNERGAVMDDAGIPRTYKVCGGRADDFPVDLYEQIVIGWALYERVLARFETSKDAYVVGKLLSQEATRLRGASVAE